MQKEIAISNWMLVSDFFFKARKKTEIIILLIFTFGLFSNFSFAQGLPLEGFEGVTSPPLVLPTGWTSSTNPAQIGNVSLKGWDLTTDGYSGKGLMVNPALNNTVGKKAEYFLTTPQFIAPNVTEVRFFTKQGSISNKGTTYELRLSTATQPSIGSFVTVQSWTEAQLNASPTDYEEKIVTLPVTTLPAGTPIYLAFVAVTNQTGAPSTVGDSWFVDNVRVIDSCPQVTGIVATMSANSGLITWSSSAAKFEIQVVLKGQGIETDGTVVNGLQYTASDLNANTDYDVYIKTDCDATTESLWAGPFAIKTAKLGFQCATPIVIPTTITTSPFILSTNLNTFYDNQTYTPLNSQGLSCQPVSQTMNFLSGDHAFLTYTPTVSGLVNVGLSVDTSTKACANAYSSVFIFDSCTGIGTTASCFGSLATGTSLGNTVQLQNLYLQAGTTYYFVISSPFQHSDTQLGAGICFTFTLSQPSCSIPSGISYNSLLQTNAKFSWDNPQNLVSKWEYIAKPAPQGPPNASDVLTQTSTNTNNTATSLTPNTDYNFYVRSICGSTPGAWSNALPFTTQCTVFPAPYSTNFSEAVPSNGVVPAIPEPCWSSLDLNKDGISFTYSQDASSNPPATGVYARLHTMDSRNQTNDMLISPQIHLDGVTQKRLRFKFKGYGGYTDLTGFVIGQSTFKIVASTTGVGPDNFTAEILPIQTYQSGKDWVELRVSIPANLVGDVNFAWYLPPGANSINTAANFQIDDVFVEDLPACSEPSYPGVTAGSIAQTSAQFYWTNGFGNTKWEVLVQPLNTGTPADTATGVPAGTNPFLMTGLTPSTRYEYYVRANCDIKGNSIWVGPVAFNTLCDALAVPYHESFNDTDAASKKFCWSIINKAGDATQWTISATQATISPQDTFTTQFAQYDDYLVSPQVNAIGKKILKFQYKVSPYIFSGGQRGNLEVLMSSTPDFANPTVLIPSHDFLNQDFAEESVIFTGTAPAYFAIHIPPTMDNPRNSGLVAIDDFSIDDVVGCPNPSLLTASNILVNSATLSWKPGFDETQWEVAIQSPNSGVPAGSGTVVNTNPTYNATGLAENTTYEYYVRANCGSDYSDWIGPFQFKTLCSILPTPFIETFEADSPSKSCWTVVNNNQDTVQWSLSATVNPIFGAEMAALSCFKNGNNDDWMITPTLAVKPNQRLRFYYKSLYDPGYLEDLKVQVSTDGVDISKFTTILYENNVTTTTDATGAIAGSNTITVASVTGIRLGDAFYSPSYPFPSGATVTAINGLTVTLSAAAAQTVAGPLAVVFDHEYINNLVAKEKVINLTGITAATNVNFAFHVPTLPPDPSGLRGSYLLIDNVIVEDIPVCPSVFNVATSATSITDTTAIIDWQTAGSETSWQISVQPFGTPAPVGNTQPQYLRTATAHPYTLTGLTPSTKYQYYVRSVCSGTSENEWVGPFDLLTKCDLSNVCQYTISLSNGSTGQVYQALDVIQNGVVQQSLTFPVVAPNQPTVLDYQVFLCSGIDFSLYWRGAGSGLQYSQAQVVIKDQSGNTVFTSPLGLGKVNTNIFTGVSSCTAVTCAQPTNLAVNSTGVLSWTPGGSETQWEVFVQPLGQGSIPQSGVIVNTPSYTPVASDFALSPTAGTNEFFVRAVCSSTDKSYWTGPKMFIRNDEPTTAVPLQVSTDGTCSSQGTNASFIGATVSDTATSCAGVNGGDIWYEFVATSKVATVELSNFSGQYYASGYGQSFPTIVMSLYEVQADGSLVEKACSENNSIVAAYSSELTVGNTYKIRVKYNDTVANATTFNICVSAPADICNMDAFNYSFEKLPLQDFGGTATYIYSKLVPGWRTNTDGGIMFFWTGTNSEGFVPYEGGQCIQLVQDLPAVPTSPSDTIIKGLYKDFETPAEIQKVKYSFASATRSTNTGTTVELYAGPPSGPFTLVTSDTTNSHVWHLITGTYIVPAGQTATRFIFRVKDNAIGHLLDAADFKADTDILTKDPTLTCDITSTTASAEGVGQWVADTGNPALTIIDAPASQTVNISGFNTPGVYTYYWTTRYCQKTFKVTYQGFFDTATVTTPVKYCLNETPTALTATAPTGFTMLWYSVPVGGTGDVNAPTPSATAVGTTTYYVALVNAGGCIGPRTKIDVIVSDYSNPVLGFSYDNVEYCLDGAAPVITTVEGFTSGGTFTSTPAGLTIDPKTGAIDLSSSTPGVDYTVTYSVIQQDCHLAGTQSVTVKVDKPCGYIQKGISPNGDGSNDKLDLTLLHIKKINIFNRYGTEVYSHGEGYTDQWSGQTNGGHNLPDGTYFYDIVKEDNTRLTGWIYIIR